MGKAYLALIFGWVFLCWSRPNYSYIQSAKLTNVFWAISFKTIWKSYWKRVLGETVILCLDAPAGPSWPFPSSGSKTYAKPSSLVDKLPQSLISQELQRRQADLFPENCALLSLTQRWPVGFWFRESTATLHASRDRITFSSVLIHWTSVPW